MYITRNGKKIELTRKEIGSIMQNEFESCYLEWAEERFEDYNTDKKITKKVEAKMKKIAKETYNQFQRDDEISEREYEIFSDVYSNYITDGEE